MKNYNIRRLSISIILPIALLLLLFVFSQSQIINEEDQVPLINNLNIEEEKHKGAHLYGRKDSSNFQFLTRNNIKWVTVIEWGSQKNCSSPIIRHHNEDSVRMRRRDSSRVKEIEVLRAAGFKVFLKPHIWIDEPAAGKWRSDIFPTSDENSELWKASYLDFILRYANLAERGKAEMFCIGTEFSRLTVEKPLFWKEVIREVRKVYSGKITYAANWYNEFEKITFWEDLDYIGIQAYFPLAKKEYASVKQISKGWRKYLPLIKRIHKKYNRKVLFTELGYKSTSDTAISPWEWVDHESNQFKSFSGETQANCYQAFFDMVWEKDWFAGVHFWVLRTDDETSKSFGTNLNFTPIGKPAEQVMAKGFE